MRIRQLFDRDTGTYTYLLYEPASREAALIYPVREQFERDAALVLELGLNLRFVLETHIHADHVTSAALLRDAFGARIALHAASGAGCADLLLADGAELALGDERIRVLHTPGHTDTDASYRVDGAVFTGDTLLVRGCGRTDFQSGDPRRLYASVTRRLFTLPEHTVVYPGHDYRGFTSSTIGEDKRNNPRLGEGIGEAEFVRIMQALDLPEPRRIAESVPGNSRCGLAAA